MAKAPREAGRGARVVAKSFDSQTEVEMMQLRARYLASIARYQVYLQDLLFNFFYFSNLYILSKSIQFFIEYCLF